MEVFKLGDIYLKNIDLKNTKFNINIEDNKRCYARLWGNGSYGNDRCTRVIKENCLCKKHLDSSKKMGGKWWLGLITEERPEEPEHPISGKHKWTKDNYGNDYKVEIKNIVKEEKVEKVKRPRGRPKGSKNKKFM